jgi:hypothetical protein
MKAAGDLLQTIQALGGRLDVDGEQLHVKLPKGCMTPELREALSRSKPELLLALATQRQELDGSLASLEQSRIALRIESLEHGGLWLVSNNACLSAVDDSNPVYTAQDARFLVELEPEHALLLHRFRRVFGGSVQFKDRIESELREGSHTTSKVEGSHR